MSSGSIVRYGPNKLIFDSHVALEGIALCSDRIERLLQGSDNRTDIYGFSKNVKKSKAYLPLVPNNYWSTLTTIDKSVHRVKRKVFSQCLSEHAVKDYEPSLLTHVGSFCKRLQEGLPDSDTWSEARAMDQWCSSSSCVLRSTS